MSTLFGLVGLGQLRSNTDVLDDRVSPELTIKPLECGGIRS